MKFQLSFLAFCFFLNTTTADDIESSKCYSDKSYLYAIGSTIQFENREFPLPSPNSEQDETTCSLPSIRLSLKNERLGIQKLGKFFGEYCTRRCVHSVQLFDSVPCGVRRSPPVYTPLIEWGVKTYNCSNLAFPMLESDKNDDVFLMKSLKKTDPNGGLPNTTLSYLSTFNVKAVSMSSLRSNVSKTQIIQFLKNMLLFCPTTTVISIRVQNYFKDITTRTEDLRIPEILPVIKQFAKIEEVIIQGINITNWDQPHDDLTNIRGVSLENTFLKDAPEWLTRCPKLNYLRFINIFDDNSNLTALNNLSELEHFELEKSEITTIKKGFLAKSLNLISLTFTCNLINKIEEGAFDHLQNLKFLTIRKNRLTSFPAGMLMSLHNLISFDIYGIGPVGSVTESNILVTCETAEVSSSPFKSQTEVCIDVMPDFPYPEKIIGLEISQCSALTDKLRSGYLKEFPNLEHLRLSDSNLTGFGNMSLESLCNLKTFIFNHNALSDEDWFPEEFYVNNVLEQSFGQKLSSHAQFAFSSASPTLLAMLKGNFRFSQNFYFSVSSIGNYVDQMKAVCELEILKYATVFGYKIENETCAAEGQKRIERVKQLEERRLNDNKCLRV